MGYAWLDLGTRNIGHRLTGSANGRRAEAFADSLFRACGIQEVSRFAFSAPAWSRGSVRFEVLSPQGAPNIECVALANTPVDARSEFDLVDGGNGLRADLEQLGGGLRGKAVLLNLGLIDAPEGAANLHRSEKTALALKAGASAVVFINNVSGHVLLTGTASINGSLIPVPAVCVSSESGAWLRGRLRAGDPLRVRITMVNQCDTVEANNIIAEIPGGSQAGDVILVGGHLDSWDLATGATDNGLGSFSILDMARCFAALDIRPARTIRFVLFMGEEQGLLGSRALVEHYRQTGELARIKAMINLDMSGHPSGFQVGAPSAWRGLVERCSDAIHRVDTSYAGKIDDRLGLHSDHQPFMLAGVPVIAPICDLGGHVYHCYHSSCDDIGLVDPAAMVDNVRIVGMLLYQLAMVDELPAGFDADQLRERLIACGLEEPLRVGGDWPWP